MKPLNLIQENSSTNNKLNFYALVIGIILGIIAAFLAVNSSFAWSYSFIFFASLFSLIVSLIARKKIILLGLVPSVVTAIVYSTFMVIFSIQHPLSANYYYKESVEICITTIIAIVISFILSGTIALIRKILLPNIR